MYTSRVQDPMCSTMFGDKRESRSSTVIECVHTVTGSEMVANDVYGSRGKTPKGMIFEL